MDRVFTKKKQKAHYFPRFQCYKTLIGFGNVTNKAEPVHICNDDREKKEVQAPTEDVKERSGKRPVFKKTK
jgi:hypothetical protein